jgi:soluble lytic murein transglycosylase
MLRSIQGARNWGKCKGFDVPSRTLCTFSALVFIAVLAIAAPSLRADSLSQPDAKALKTAIAAAKLENWKSAAAQASRLSSPLSKKFVTWLIYKAPNSGATFADITKFIDENPDWPWQNLLRQRAEESLTETIPDHIVLNWFKRYPPVSASGSIAQIAALVRTNRRPEAVTLAQRAWVNSNMGRKQERSFRRQFRKMLRPEDEAARIDRLLWDERISAARRQMRYVPKDHKALAEARIRLIERRGGVDAAIAHVPDHLVEAPGLVYERLRWRRKKRFDESALELLIPVRDDLVRPSQWWTERHILARRVLQKGDAALAYQIASEHGQMSGQERAEAEWLAGWIALRFLDNHEAAFIHFKTLYENVRYPISRSRGAYWAGRAAAAAGKHVIASLWYAVAASHVTTFYGQLAAAQLSQQNQPIIPPELPPTDAETTNFEQNELVRVVRMLAKVEASDESEPFFRQLARMADGRAIWTLTARLARDVGRSDLAILAAKRAERSGVVLSESGYPALPIQQGREPDIALVHAVIRQESAFDPNAISPRGARGLMQIMPRTAQSLAQQLKISHRRSLLTTDPDHNMRLGSAYLADLLESYDSSMVLSLAAYNAGKSRVKMWLADYGDPRENGGDAIDWIESIPFGETRNYVQRVLENFSVYSQRLHGRRANAIFQTNLDNFPTELFP